MTDENYRKIQVDVEPRSKIFEVAIQKESTVEELVSTLIRRCEDEGIKIAEWGRSKVGQSNVSFVLMRKATGNTAIAPTVTFGELFPELEERETFKLDARAQVGNKKCPECNAQITKKRMYRAWSCKNCGWQWGATAFG
jgi:ribosomal protein L37AE/L43A